MTPLTRQVTRLRKKPLTLSIVLYNEPDARSYICSMAVRGWSRYSCSACPLC